MMFIVLFTSCSEINYHKPVATSNQVDRQEVQVGPNTISTRFVPPPNYQRNQAESGSFASYLRSLSLKPKESKVAYFDGRQKPNNGIYLGVVDQKIGEKDLHQCADAIIRLRADYLWHQGKYDDIHFNFTSGFQANYRPWMNGQRIKVQDSNVSWIQGGQASNTYDDFWAYLEQVFMYAGTASLAKEMKAVETSDAEIGDVLIQGGFPGHAVIIVDKVINQGGQSLYLLAQSYMPAQQLQILANAGEPSISPWYTLEGDIISTPEWTFYSSDLKRL